MIGDLRKLTAAGYLDIPPHVTDYALVDGRPVAAATPLDRAGIGDGAEVRRADAPTDHPAAPPVVIQYR